MNLKDELERMKITRFPKHQRELLGCVLLCMLVGGRLLHNLREGTKQGAEQGTKRGMKHPWGVASLLKIEPLQPFWRVTIRSM